MNAYIMVLMFSISIFLLISISLTVTARSRQVTQRYQYFTSLYDLAVAGNEKALSLLNRTINENRAEILYYLTEETPEAFAEAAMPLILANMPTQFTPELLAYNLHWSKHLTLANINHHYQATTTVTPRSNYFAVRTIIRKQTPDSATPGLPVEISASIIWPNLGICLDYYALIMVELLRIAD